MGSGRSRGSLHDELRGCAFLIGSGGDANRLWKRIVGLAQDTETWWGKCPSSTDAVGILKGIHRRVNARWIR